MLEYLLYIKNNSITLQLKITTIELSNILWVKNSISFQMIRFISALHGWSYFMALLLVTSLWHSVSSFVASLSTWSLTIQRSSPHKSWSPKSLLFPSIDQRKSQSYLSFTWRRIRFHILVVEVAKSLYKEK